MSENKSKSPRRFSSNKKVPAPTPPNDPTNDPPNDPPKDEVKVEFVTNVKTKNYTHYRHITRHHVTEDEKIYETIKTTIPRHQSNEQHGDSPKNTHKSVDQVKKSPLSDRKKRYFDNDVRLMTIEDSSSSPEHTNMKSISKTETKTSTTEFQRITDSSPIPRSTANNSPVLNSSNDSVYKTAVSNLSDLEKLDQRSVSNMSINSIKRNVPKQSAPSVVSIASIASAASNKSVGKATKFDVEYEKLGGLFTKLELLRNSLTTNVDSLQKMQDDLIRQFHQVDQLRRRNDSQASQITVKQIEHLRSHSSTPVPSTRAPSIIVPSTRAHSIIVPSTRAPSVKNEDFNLPSDPNHNQDNFESASMVSDHYGPYNQGNQHNQISQTNQAHQFYNESTPSVRSLVQSFKQKEEKRPIAESEPTEYALIDDEFNPIHHAETQTNKVDDSNYGSVISVFSRAQQHEAIPTKNCKGLPLSEDEGGYEEILSKLGDPEYDSVKSWHMPIEETRHEHLIKSRSIEDKHSSKSSDKESIISIKHRPIEDKHHEKIHSSKSSDKESIISIKHRPIEEMKHQLESLKSEKSIKHHPSEDKHHEETHFIKYHPIEDKHHEDKQYEKVHSSKSSDKGSIRSNKSRAIDVPNELEETRSRKSDKSEKSKHSRPESLKSSHKGSNKRYPPQLIDPSHHYELPPSTHSSKSPDKGSLKGSVQSSKKSHPPQFIESTMPQNLPNYASSERSSITFNNLRITPPNEPVHDFKDFVEHESPTEHIYQTPIAVSTAHHHNMENEYIAPVSPPVDESYATVPIRPMASPPAPPLDLEKLRMTPIRDRPIVSSPIPITSPMSPSSSSTLVPRRPTISSPIPITSPMSPDSNHSWDAILDEMLKRGNKTERM